VLFLSTPTSFSLSSPPPKRNKTTADAETAEQLLERASSSGGSGSKEPRIDGRAFRRSLTKTGRYVRNPANDAESLALMEEHGVGYSSTGLVAQMRKPENNNTWKQGNLTVTLAQAYGEE
jgi:4-hydroxy-3-methylbut-2-enyl diphosphate reductase